MTIHSLSQTPTPALDTATSSDSAPMTSTSLPFPLDAPDAALPPTRLACLAYRLRALDRRRLDGPASLREPFLELVDGLHIGPARLCVTTRVGVRGTREEPVILSDLIVTALGGDEVGAEIQALDDHLVSRIFGPQRLFTAERVAVQDLDLPVSGDAVFIRQAAISVGEGGDSPLDATSGASLPVRFAYPGAGAPARLLGALEAAGPGTDLFVSVSPTTLRESERQALERARAVASDHTDIARFRDAATAVDAVLSFRTEVSVVQILLVSQRPLAEVTRRLVASALTAGFDTQHQPGHRVVASPQRFVGGGFSIEPCRNPTEVLSRLGAGIPWIGFPERDPSDLVTATEIGYCLGWATSETGAIPGIAESGARAPEFEPTSGWTLGRDPLGSHAGIADGDRCLHLAFIGSTGSGKTTVFEQAIRHDLERGRTVIAIDPHGELLLRALRHVSRDRRDRVFFLDAATGLGDRLNLVRLSGSRARRRGQHAAIVEGAVTDLNKDFAGPVFHEVILPILTVLGDIEGDLRDLPRFFDDPRRLQAAAEEAGCDAAVALAREMRNWSASHRSEVATWARSKFHWVESEGIAATVCAGEPSFELDDALRPGSALLVHPGNDAAAGAVFSSVLLGVLLSGFAERSPGAPPVSVYLDEVQRFSGNMVRRAMNEARKRAVALHVATQNLTNVTEEFEAMLGNAGHLLIGRSIGPTAAFAGHAIGADPGSMATLANLRAMCRLSPRGQPHEAFVLEIDPPVGPPPDERPEWLDRAIEARWQAAERGARDERGE